MLAFTFVAITNILASSATVHPAIIVKLQGGLGNQLFQYAAGRSLADAAGVPLYLDLHHLYAGHLRVKAETPRTYALGEYTIDANLLAPDDQSWHRFLPDAWRKYLYREVHFRRFSHAFGEDYSQAHILSLLTEGETVLLDGFFQQERYFLPIRDKLLQQIRPRTPLSPDCHIISSKMETTHSVAVHIRRGDYVAKSFHGLLPVSYYHSAFDVIKERLKHPVFIFFSDDMPWVKDTFGQMDDVIFAEYTSSTPHTDLELMRRCKHQVIANSSFSWWGAWLNEYKEKVVIAPKNWFADQAENAAFSLPPSWIRL